MEKMRSEPKLLETYLSFIQGSVGTKIFQHSYFLIDGKTVDITKGGELSCALFVSALLKIFNLAGNLRATVRGLEKELELSGWSKVKKAKVGCVIIWAEKKDKRGEVHQHAGFCVGRDKAISNSSKDKVPKRHHITYGVRNGQPVRKITAIYEYKDLN